MTAEGTLHWSDLDVSPDPFLVSDLEGTLRFMNAPAVELLGRIEPGTDVVARAMHGDDVAAVRAVLAQVPTSAQRIRARFLARTGRVARGGLRVARSRDGASALWFMRLERAPGNPTPVPDSGAASASSRTDARLAELSRRVEAAERAAHAERMAREETDGRERVRKWTMAVVANGLRLPIEHVLRWCDVLERGGATPPAFIAEVVRAQAKAQSDLVDDLLDMGRLADRTVRAGFIPLSIVETLRSVAAAFAPVAARREVAIVIAPVDLGQIRGDVVLVQQALSNLVSCALELTALGQPVTLDGCRTSESVEVSVTWRGEALRSDQFDHDVSLFRDEIAVVDRLAGSCLVARVLVQLHGGRLRMTREREVNRLVATFGTSGSVPPSMRKPR